MPFESALAPTCNTCPYSSAAEHLYDTEKAPGSIPGAGTHMASSSIGRISRFHREECRVRSPPRLPFVLKSPMDNEYMREYMAARRNLRRTRLIELAGGECIRCGSMDQLEFDHRDRRTRLFSLSGCYLDKSWKLILDELVKCDLLCSSCHKKKSREAGDNPGGVKGRGRGSGKVPIHGTAHMYIQYACRCTNCQYARSQHRVGNINFNDRVNAPLGWKSKLGRRFKIDPS